MYNIVLMPFDHDMFRKYTSQARTCVDRISFAVRFNAENNNFAAHFLEHLHCIFLDPTTKLILMELCLIESILQLKQKRII